MITGSNPKLSYAILGHKISFMYIKPQKGTFICPKLMPKAEKIKKQKINSVPFQTTVLAATQGRCWSVARVKFAPIFYGYSSYYQKLKQVSSIASLCTLDL